ncbi:Tas Predicted oxidoreductases (related to aryl-alcohol dehydrogenases) [Candidatus Pelagibacterales bacterium]
MKLVLGSANWGQKYGLSSSKKFSISKINKVLRFSYSNKISIIDTAFIYGNTHDLLSKSDHKKFKIISKIFFTKKYQKYEIENLFDKLLKEKKKFKKSFFGLLIHNPNVLNKKNLSRLKRILNTLKKKKIVNKIGISIYDLNEYKKIINNGFQIDIIQIPINLVNTNFVNSKFINDLKKRKIKIFARSIFLQGILLNKKIPIILKSEKKILSKIYQLNKTNCLTNLEACIFFLKSLTFVDYCIIGFSSILQLKQIIKIFKKNKKIDTQLYINMKNSKKLSDPRQWHLK